MVIATVARILAQFSRQHRAAFEVLAACFLLLPVALLCGAIICWILRPVALALFWVVGAVAELPAPRQPSDFALAQRRAADLQRGRDALGRIEASGAQAVDEMQRYADGLRLRR